MTFDNDTAYSHIHDHIKAIKPPSARMCPAINCEKSDRLKGCNIRRIAEHIIFDHYPSGILCSAGCRLFARKDAMEKHRKTCCTFCEWCRNDCGNKESRVAHESECSIRIHRSENTAAGGNSGIGKSQKNDRAGTSKRGRVD